jgi:hypothetical protein
MPTNYTGNPSVTEPPSPAPAPGAVPVIQIPIDGEASSAASVQQAMRVPADFIAHLMASSRPELPVVNNAAGGGFTLPSYTSFGGTVTPSGSAHTSDGTRFVIKIIAGGAVGVATFKTSIDGGTTFGATQTTAASMTDATSGITLAFSGTFTLNGTAAFRSAFTPLAQWIDALGSVRSIIDHNGYRRGRTNEIIEDWQAWANLTGPSGPQQAGRWFYSVPASTIMFGLNATAAFPGGGLLLSTTSIPTSTSIGLTTPHGALMPQSFTSLVMEFEASMSPVGANAMNWQIGLSSSGTTNVGTPLASANQVTIGRRSSDPNTWQLFTANGTTLNVVDTGVTINTTVPDRITLELHGSASPYGARARCFINETLIETSANLPLTTTALNLILGGTSTGTATATLTVSPLRTIFNRYQSIPVV